MLWLSWVLAGNSGWDAASRKCVSSPTKLHLLVLGTPPAVKSISGQILSGIPSHEAPWPFFWMESSREWAWDRMLTLCGDWTGPCKALVHVASVSSYNSLQLCYRLDPGEMKWSGCLLRDGNGTYWGIQTLTDGFVSNHSYFLDTFINASLFLAPPSPQNLCGHHSLVSSLLSDSVQAWELAASEGQGVSCKSSGGGIWQWYKGDPFKE